MLDISNFPWAECAITENRMLYVSDPLSLKRKKRGTGKHRYEFELVTVQMPTRKGIGVMAKLSAATESTLKFIHPVLSFSTGTEPSSKIQSYGVNESGSKFLSLSSSQPWQLMSGDYIQVGNDTKVFQVVNDTLLQAGNQTVELTSALRYSLTSGVDIIVNDVEWRLESDGIIESGGMEASDNQEIELTLMAVEKL